MAEIKFTLEKKINWANQNLNLPEKCYKNGQWEPGVIVCKNSCLKQGISTITVPI